MFTGIIETTGLIKEINTNGSNKTFKIQSLISNELKVDQSLSHNGVCLTVEAVENDLHTVTAIQETLNKTTLLNWKIGDLINLERCLTFNDRIDGHIVQGHIDSTAVCLESIQLNGSWNFKFSFPAKFATLLIEKGSICLNGISLTVFEVSENTFKVAIIPYTFQHTNMHLIKPEDEVNIEYDMIGKYINRIATLRE